METSKRASKISDEINHSPTTRKTKKKPSAELNVEEDVPKSRKLNRSKEIDNTVKF